MFFLLVWLSINTCVRIDFYKRKNSILHFQIKIHFFSQKRKKSGILRFCALYTYIIGIFSSAFVLWQKCVMFAVE
jgi:hypothetical protein